MSLIVYHTRFSRSFRLIWVCEELRLPYETVHLRFPPSVHHPEYLAINPSGSVPTLVDGDSIVIESVAGLEYLLARYDGSHLAVPPGHRDFAHYLQFLHMGEAGLGVNFSIILRFGILGSDGLSSLAIVADAESKFLKRLLLLDHHLDGRQFLAGDSFTAADISIGWALQLAYRYNYGDRFPPQVLRYWEMLQTIPSYARALDANALPELRAQNSDV